MKTIAKNVLVSPVEEVNLPLWMLEQLGNDLTLLVFLRHSKC